MNDRRYRATLHRKRGSNLIVLGLPTCVRRQNGQSRQHHVANLLPARTGSWMASHPTLRARSTTGRVPKARTRIIQARCVSERRGKYSCPSAGRFVPRTVRSTKKSGPATTAHKSSSSNKNCTRVPLPAMPHHLGGLVLSVTHGKTFQRCARCLPTDAGVSGVPSRLRERACMFSHPRELLLRFPSASPEVSRPDDTTCSWSLEYMSQSCLYKARRPRASTIAPLVYCCT
ncbi:hypothetical protein C8Q73DRAFT_29867 [Cubamyces lactineus]|nr:hypothetical protein C8Q73DRAFT_29867 [Cubamyces lactineus]